MKLVPGNFGLATSILPTQDQKAKFIQRKNIQIKVNKIFKNNPVRIQGLLKADVRVPIKNPSVNGSQTASIKQLIMTIKSKEDFKTPMICGVDLITSNTKEPFYVATYFSGFRKKVETLMSHLPVFLKANFGKKYGNASSSCSRLK